MKNFFLYIIVFSILSHYTYGQIKGCTDPFALNYNREATINDGSCAYEPTTIFNIKSQILPSFLSETSGLLFFNNKLWSHNDGEDSKLYEINPANVKEILGHPMGATVKNIDWEDLTQDQDYVYIGDFGNNTSGNRRDLRVLRINKRGFLGRRLIIDTIRFIYSKQYIFTPTGYNNTDFDCEAFITIGDSLYLFTKEWLSNKTSVYSVYNKPGMRVARLQTTFDVGGLITGAYYDENVKKVVLCGYSNMLEPFLYLLYDYNDVSFFTGNKRKIMLNLALHQIEGITSKNGKVFYLTNEDFSRALIKIPQKLHVIDLSPFLRGNTDTPLSHF